MAILQVMKHAGYNNNDDYELIHVVEEVLLGGEYTVCGMAIPDSLLQFEGFERVGDEFHGSYKRCTCPICKRKINYYKVMR